MLPSVKTLDQLGYKLYASKGTADFYTHNGVTVLIINRFFILSLFF